MKTGAVLALILAFLVVGSQATYEEREFCLPRGPATIGIQTYLNSIHMCLDNWGPWKGIGQRWYNPDGSFVVFPSGKQIQLKVLPSKAKKVPNKPGFNRWYEAYVKDVCTQDIDFYPYTHPKRGQLNVLRIHMESAGPEVKIGCSNTRTDKPCKAHFLNHDISLNNFNIRIYFKLMSTKNKPSFVQMVPQYVKVDFDIKPDSWVLDKLNNVINYFYDLKGYLVNEVEEAVMDELERDDIQEQLTFDLNGMITDKLIDFVKSRLGDSSTVSKWVEDNTSMKSFKEKKTELCFTVRYPKPVHALTTKIHYFRAVDPLVKRMCPFQFPFESRVSADAPVSGYGYIRYSDGTKSGNFNWGFSKPGSSTAKFYKTISENKSGRAILYLRHKLWHGGWITKRSAFLMRFGSPYNGQCELGIKLKMGTSRIEAEEEEATADDSGFVHGEYTGETDPNEADDDFEEEFADLKDEE
ncbi:hypothetical protein NDN08_004895 [Rhodosorus marinus]|uniref:Uncharacterized protein n=1 Tax=Rhodosorus marinus TaxID=101924 RepID=A0AAV8UHN4_9RHOD|nr:hypothetical protein NDN08_004895 [Rhodosorus marinus]